MVSLLGKRILARSAVVAAGFAFVTASSAIAAEGPFSGLSGTWSGGGTIQMTNGSTERLRCRVSYAVGGTGDSLQQDLRCASDSYRVDVRSDVVANGGNLSGSWSETSRGASGDVRGRINGKDITARVDGAGFSAGLSIATRGSQQSVSIRTQNADVSAVNVSLHRN